MGSELLDDILAVLKVTQHKADGSITFWCPFHPDGQGNPPHTPNGVIKPGNKGASYVWACPVCDIGGTLLDLADRLRQGGMMPPRESKQSDAKIVKTYPYHDEQGRLLFEVLRRSNKGFCQRRPDGKGDWIWNLDGVRRVPYHLPELLTADPGQWVFIPEGEKDCNNLALVGLVATTNPGGAGKWREEFGPYLKGRKVAILPDNDAPGQAHAEDVAAKIAPYAAEVRIVSLPDLPPGGDVSDWLKGGRTAKELGALVEAVPYWEPHSTPVDTAGTPILVRLADVERQEVEWLWEGRLPKGRLTILDGDPGVGKSWLALAIATAITRGTSLPGQESAGEPANVLLLTAEDGLADTVRARLEDMGADLKGVTVLTAVHDKEGNERHLSLVDNLAALDMALAPGGYGLVIIDPINAYLGIALDTHRDAALRSVLTPLAQLAERWGVAIIC
ncbi:MAG: AAA family ATPase, partial [Dehalococcoidia bacterium]